MSKNEILFDKKMMKKMRKGRAIIHKAVALTMGAAGKNIAYRSNYSGRPAVTNDGISVARMINLEDESEAMGADMMTQSAERTNEEAGDATSATIVLDYWMGEKGLEVVSDKKFLGITYKKGLNSMVVKRQMNESVSRLNQKISEIAIPIRSEEDLFNIANISFENREHAKTVADAVSKVGKDGEVRVEESSFPFIQKIDEEGLKFSKGYVTPYMITDPQKMESILTDVPVLITDKSFQLNKDLWPVIEYLNRKNVTKLFVICGGMSGEILASLIKNRMAGKFICVAVEKPYDDNVLEDIAILTGGKVISSVNNPGDLNENHVSLLGRIDKVIVTEKSTLIIGGDGDKKEIAARVEALKKEAEATEHSYTKDKLKERIAKILGGVVIIKVGAPTESDMKYLKDKFDDAVANTRSALEEGIIPGGGRVLYDFSLEPAVDAGDEIVKYACTIPMKTILKNAGINKLPLEGHVYNVLTGKVTSNPIEDGLIDSAKSQRCALKNAVNEASTFITLEGSIVDIPIKNEREMV